MQENKRSQPRLLKNGNGKLVFNTNENLNKLREYIRDLCDYNRIEEIEK